jgi:hypothetical protein
MILEIYSIYFSCVLLQLSEKEKSKLNLLTDRQTKEFTIAMTSSDMDPHTGIPQQQHVKIENFVTEDPFFPAYSILGSDIYKTTQFQI